MKAYVIAALGALTISTAAVAQVKELSGRLDTGMTTKQVMAALGYSPNSVNQMTCGANLGAAFTCRIWTFQSWDGGLNVTFERSGSEWVVNSWNVY